MLKHLTFALTAALLSACTVVSDDTDGNSNSNSNSATDTNNTSGATTSGTTTDGTTNPTSGTTTDATTNPTTGTTTDAPTTDAPTTDATTVGTMTTGTTLGTTGGDTEGTTGGDTETTGGALYGNCGWNVVGYYACLDMGGVPGTEDPMMKDPIACPQDIMEGVACDDMGMGGIGSVGCCTPEGVNYFCDVEGNKKVFADDCAM